MVTKKFFVGNHITQCRFVRYSDCVILDRFLLGLGGRCPSVHKIEYVTKVRLVYSLFGYSDQHDRGRIAKILLGIFELTKRLASAYRFVSCDFSFYKCDSHTLS